MKTTFRKLMFPGQTGVYDPETEGFFAVAFVEGANGEHIGADGGKRSVQLAQGCVSTPRLDRDAVERELALLLAEFPFLASKVAIFKVPCAFSDRASWVLLSGGVLAKWERLAPVALRWMRGGSWIVRDAWARGDADFLACMERELAGKGGAS